MNGTLALEAPTNRPTLSAMAIGALTLLVVAAVALGFGLRSWTESAPATPAPIVRVVQQPTPPSVGTNASGSGADGSMRRISGAS